jgi:hypothetical protein
VASLSCALTLLVESFADLSCVLTFAVTRPEGLIQPAPFDAFPSKGPTCCIAAAIAAGNKPEPPNKNNVGDIEYKELCAAFYQTLEFGEPHLHYYKPDSVTTKANKERIYHALCLNDGQLPGNTYWVMDEAYNKVANYVVMCL